MAVGRYCGCYVAGCSDGSWSLLVTICSLMLRLELVAGGDVVQLVVEKSFGRYR